MNPIIIIVPVYNNSSLIRDLVTRLSAVENADILFIDDGSEDGTFDLIKRVQGGPLHPPRRVPGIRERGPVRAEIFRGYGIHDSHFHRPAVQKAPR